MKENDSERAKVASEQVAELLRQLLAEMREINTSLKSIARSQANQTSVQKAFGAKTQAGGERR